MLQFEELRLELNDNKQKLSELREALGLDALKEEIAKLEEQTAAEEFWGDIENSQKVLQRISQLKNKVAAYTSLETAFDDTMTLIELADEEEDLSMFDECREGVTKFEDELEKQTLSTLLNGEYDAKNALLTFHAGAGEQALVEVGEVRGGDERLDVPLDERYERVAAPGVELAHDVV